MNKIILAAGMPDGNFTLHMAYGIRDKSGFGAMEITGYNSKTGDFDSYNFNPDGSFEMFTLTINNNDGKTYELFMDGVLTKGSDF